MSSRLYIPFRKRDLIGGPSRFRENLKKYLDSTGFSYCKNSENAFVLFFPVSMPEDVIKAVKARGGKIIQRLDGIYYPSKHGDHHSELNKEIKKIYGYQADHVVFQSEYSRLQCFAMFGEKDEDSYQIIMNGVDKQYFYPADDRREVKKRRKVRLITSGNFRNRDMIEPIVKALDLLTDSYDLELVVLGPVTNSDLECFLKRKDIVHQIAHHIKDVAKALRDSHIFVYSHLNPPCPNSVIEAVSCGLPVVGFDSGSMRELVPFGLDLLAYVSDDLFQKYEDFKAEALAEKLSFAVDNYDTLKAQAMSYSHLYPFDECGKKYVTLFSLMLHALGKEDLCKDRSVWARVAGMCRR